MINKCSLSCQTCDLCPAVFSIKVCDLVLLCLLFVPVMAGKSLKPHFKNMK